MKKTFLIVLVFTSITACKENNKKEETPNNPIEQTESKPLQTDVFDITKVPITKENIGEFPYLSAPESYKYDGNKTKEYEEKLFFYNDSMVYEVGGKYYHTRIFPMENVEFSATYVVKNYAKTIEKLGGIEIFDGPLNKTYNRVLKDDLPYLKDLYDPFAYKYKQFLIKTPKENIWVELIHGLNADMIDFTVVKEEALKETITILKASDIQKQLDEKGKAILYINFDTDKASLQPEGKEAVNEISLLLEQHKDLKLSIEGHTDNTGTASHNQSLSEERAKMVLKQLTANGINNSRLQAKGFGDKKPLIANDSEESRGKNRRVELVKL